MSIVSSNTISSTYNKTSEAVFEEFTFDVTKIVNSKLINNENSITFVIQLENDKVRDKAYVSFADNYRPELIIE